MKTPNALPVILVADDNPDDRFLFGRLLSKVGVRNPVVFAENGEAAISYLRGERVAAGHTPDYDPPFLVFLDVHMPRCSGFDVLEWVKRNGGCPKTRFVIMTDSTDPDDFARAKALRVDDYILKMPRGEALAALIDPDRPAPGES